MAQAAKHLRKNKDLEALAEQERKEKEEEKNKRGTVLGTESARSVRNFCVRNFLAWRASRPTEAHFFRAGIAGETAPSSHHPATGGAGGGGGVRCSGLALRYRAAGPGVRFANEIASSSECACAFPRESSDVI
ncbi:hypothetical protein ANANG_G00189300 [Anguilla anguilla]|uniref:Uncharacterized protein n=1 Tax=Anguilla anguilla TaxID=7936 RepID=A0A9D3M4D4_ANGAN|nr:hypothetical protein ANANG_G00189300 [Anguilla anguilla]